MPSIDFTIDLHTHPTYKPLGRAFQTNQATQSSNPDDENSLWHYNPPTLMDKLINMIGGLTKFSQTNFTASAYGKLWVIVVSLGSIEKWFFNNRMGTGELSDILEDFATELGNKRIDAIQNMTDYFADLMQEFDFLEQMHNKEVIIDGNKYQYRIVNNFNELNAAMLENEAAVAAADKSKPIIIALITSIEGMHVLNCGLDADRSPENPKANPGEVIANAKRLKAHNRKPWFITFSHHFYNELCGQSESLRGMIAATCDQHIGMGTGFTDLGLQVLDILLDNTDGRRVFIDVKHLSPLSRKQFFELRQTKYQGIPIIMSHGMCNGLRSFDDPVLDNPDLGIGFNNKEINFYDNEILLMAQSGGIMGLQLDERRVASDAALHKTKHSFFRNKIMHYRSELVWKHIQYVAELLDKNGLYAWGSLALGSDYDGIVDPLNSFWTAEQYPALKSYLERHAFNYVQNKSSQLQNSFNKIDADLIVQNVFQNNAWAFLERWF